MLVHCTLDGNMWASSLCVMWMFQHINARQKTNSATTTTANTAMLLKHVKHRVQLLFINWCRYIVSHWSGNTATVVATSDKIEWVFISFRFHLLIFDCPLFFQSANGCVTWESLKHKIRFFFISVTRVHIVCKIFKRLSLKCHILSNIIMKITSFIGERPPSTLKRQMNLFWIANCDCTILYATPQDTHSYWFF